MAKRPWFTDPRTGTLPMPVSIEGWLALGTFVVLLLASGLSHAQAMWPLRIALGAGYVGLAFLTSDGGA